ncbi:MAG: DUF305 domain-containing protein [Synechococcaceae cyanobacterium]|nr:DUF305 domain-containing protein [Synechococcaceae cyanobacterium]
MRVHPVLLLIGWIPAMALAQPDPHHHHHPAAPSGQPPAAAPAPASPAPLPLGVGAAPQPSHSHAHDLGPAGATYDLRWLDAMVEHHTGALRMAEFVFDVGAPGVGALARSIWSDQAAEIRAMTQWRRAWYPQAPVHPVVLRAGGDPDAMADLVRMSPEQIAAMRMMGDTPSRSTRVHWFLERMLHHHGAALEMAHDALRHSRNPSVRRLARQIITNQRREIWELRRMLIRDGFDKPEYHRYDPLFVLW